MSWKEEGVEVPEGDESEEGTDKGGRLTQLMLAGDLGLPQEGGGGVQLAAGLEYRRSCSIQAP